MKHQEIKIQAGSSRDWINNDLVIAYKRWPGMREDTKVKLKNPSLRLLAELYSHGWKTKFVTM